MTRLLIRFSDGAEYELDAEIVAERRADYYACTVDGFERYSKEWHEEFQYSMEPLELLDWVQNNMDLDNELFSKMKLVQTHRTVFESYQEQWTNAHMEVDENV